MELLTTLHVESSAPVEESRTVRVSIAVTDMLPPGGLEKRGK